MTKKEKLLQRVKNNPKDTKFSEVQQLLKDAEFRENSQRAEAAITIYYHESLDRIVTLTKGTKRLPEYQVKDALRALQILEGEYEKG